MSIFAEGVVKDTIFQVVDADIAYTMILGRPRIYDIDEVPLTLHQVTNYLHNEEFVR